MIPSGMMKSRIVTWRKTEGLISIKRTQATSDPNVPGAKGIYPINPSVAI